MDDRICPAHEDDFSTEIKLLLEGPRDETVLKFFIIGDSSTPKDGLRCGPRGPRKRRLDLVSLENIEGLFCQPMIKPRKNNQHWTSDEVNRLVEGVASHGVGRWSQLKAAHFSTSIRTAVNLKDKWRNLLRACGVKISSKKAKAQKNMLWPLGPRLIKRIRELAARHPYPKRRHDYIRKR